MRLLATFAILLATSVHAETIVVQSGEHADFTRIVLNPREQSSWSFTQGQGAYSLKFMRQDTTFDLRDVFKLIPRTRIADVVFDKKSREITFKVNNGVIANASEDDPGIIIIDFVNGESSPQVDEPKDTSNASIVVPAMDAAGQFDFFWRGIPEAPVLSPEASKEAAVPSDGHKTGQPPSLMNERIAKAEEQMLEQLSRAASQGLVSLDVVPQEFTPPVPIPATSSPTVAPQTEESPADALGATAETAIDRDAIAPFEKQSYSSNGVNCYPDSYFDLSYTDEETPIFSKIVETRLSIVGEFDKAVEDEVEELARLYLVAGFGAEARSTLRSFEQEQEKISARISSLQYMADIIDSEPVASGEKITSMLDCDGDVALWALLGAAKRSDAAPVNVRAVIRAFSELPQNLKEITYERAADQLIKFGFSDAAQDLKNSKNRAGVPEDQIDFSDAKLNLSHGDKEKAREELTTLSSEPSINSGAATLLLIEDKIAEGELPAENQILDLESMLLPMIPSPEGKRALTAYVVAAARSGRFGDAFAAYDKWGEGVALENGASLIFDELAHHADGFDFVDNYFIRSDVYLSSVLKDESILIGAQKLIQSGFFDEALQLLDKSSKKTYDVTVARAQSYIGKKQPEEALKRLESLEGDEAKKLKAEAMALLGNDLEAAALFRESSEAEKAADMSWRAGDWANLTNGADPQAQALRTVLAPITSDSNAPPSISAAEDKIKSSQKFRESIQGVFGQ